MTDLTNERFQTLVATVDALIESCGSRDFRDVLKKFSKQLGDVFVFDLGTIVGFATHHGKMPVIALHSKLQNTPWFQFTGWHELEHILDGDVGQNAGPPMQDYGVFQHDVYDKRIPENELKCNLISAHVNVDTDAVLDMICYNSPTMREYRELKEALQNAKQKIWNILDSIDRNNPSRSSLVRLNNLKRDIESMTDSLEALQYELTDMDAFKSFATMARELNVPERILKYKLEALRLLDYDIDPQELEDYGTMFEDATESREYYDE